MTNERAYTPSLVLHVLRNPHGWSVEAITAARLQAADEIERLRDALKRVRRVAAEGTTHTGMIAALGILVDRALNPGNGPLPPDYTYHSHEPLQGASFPVHADPTGTTREPPHCPTCECGICGCPDEYCLKLAGSLKPGVRCADDLEQAVKSLEQS